MTRHSLDRIRITRGHVTGTESVTVRLPFPPSVNNLFMTVGHRRVATTRYQEWRLAARAALLMQRPKMIIGPCEVVVTLEEKSGRHDADNCLKATLDCLCENGIIQGDDNKIVRRVTAQWGDVEGALVEVRRVRL